MRFIVMDKKGETDASTISPTFLASSIRNRIAFLLTTKGHKIVNSPEPADLAIIIGGDGFMIHNVARFSKLEIPCIGINVGDVGFLMSGNSDEWEAVLERIISGQFRIEKRTGLELFFYDAIGNEYRHNTVIINDVYLKHPESIATFIIQINGEDTYECSGDGMIVGTSTGSTGYNRSARGPIVVPGVPCILLTPLCPTTVNAESLVTPEESEIRIKVKSSKEDKPVTLFADGRRITEVIVVKEIVVKKSATKALFATFGHKQFYKALQEKKGLIK